jgi:hypothetical protein
MDAEICRINQDLLRRLKTHLIEASGYTPEAGFVIGWTMGAQAYNEWWKQLRPEDQERVMNDELLKEFYVLDPAAEPWEAYARFV